MLPMIPGAWYQRPQQNPGLTLAQAANPMLQTIPQFPQPLPMPTLPALPGPQAPQFLGSSIPPKGLEQTLAAPPQAAPGAEFSYYDDDSLMDAYSWETNPERKQRMLLELTRRQTGAEKWPELTPIDQRPVDPGYKALQVQEQDRSSPGPKGNYGPAWTSAPPAAEPSIGRNPYETQRGAAPDPSFEALLASLFGGGASADLGGGAGDLAIPALPGRPSPSAAPDFGPFPEAPVLAGPDYSKANEYFEAAKPQPYEKSQEEMGLAVLAGALGGFSPYGDVGEILGRMAGPGIQSGFGQYKEDKALGREYDRDLAAWNAAMGQQAGSQAGTAAEVANQNAQFAYENAAAKYQDAQNRYNMAREEDRWQASYDLQRARAELDQAQLGLQRQIAEARVGYYNRGGAGGAGGGLSMGSVLKTISDGVNQGALPGIEGMNEQMAATRQSILTEAQQDPNRLALFMSDPSQLDMEVRRRLTEQIFQLAQTDQNLMMQLVLASLKGKTGLGLEDVLGGLAGE